MLLALETSGRSVSIAMGPLGGPFEEVCLPHGRSEDLAPAVRNLVGLAPEQITHYALGIGPGSFTGLRVGLCFLKGYGLAFPRPVVPVSSFRVVAEQAFENVPELRSVLVVLDARNGEVLAGRYLSEGQAVSADPTWPDGLYRLDTIASRIGSTGDGLDGVAGDGSALLGSALTPIDPTFWVPRAATLAKLAAAEIALGHGRDLLGLEPAYLQKPTAERRRTEGSD